jgi:hypothetical protein
MMKKQWPSKEELDGMTVNERLYACGLLYAFDEAARNRDRDQMITILLQTTLDRENAEATTDAVMKNPEMYGY